MDVRTLQYWHKLEHFYPYELGAQTNKNIRSCHIDTEESFDAFLAESSASNRPVRYYAIYLGLFQVDNALQALESGLGQKMSFYDSDNEQNTSCFCQFNVNEHFEFNPNSFKISSFPWAVHRVRDGKINIDHWDDDFLAFERGALLRLCDKNTPLDYTFLLGLRDWFAKHMNWNMTYCDYWMRIDCIVGNMKEGEDEQSEPVTPEDKQAEDMATDEQVKQNDLLNSFYIRDLERIIDSIKQDEHSAGECLRQYLGRNTKPQIDIEQDKDALLELLSPAYLPLGKWPSSYGLRLMQQVDINSFLCDDPKYHQYLFSVNGPPGTGKTTLLKDIIAAIVVNRAVQLCKLEMPNDAFYKESLCAIKTASGYANPVRDIQPDLKRHGILIASNNNGAVENVTHTLPALEEVAEDYIGSEHHYFSGVSDLLFGAKKTWALNAAALGNKLNRNRFADVFWPLDLKHDGYNFRTELSSQTKTMSSEDWNAAKQSFGAKLNTLELKYRQAEQAYDVLQGLLATQKKRAAFIQDIQAGNETLSTLNAAMKTHQTTITSLEMKCAHLKAKRKDVEDAQSFFLLKKLFLPRAEFMQIYRDLQHELIVQVEALHQARDAEYHTQKKIHLIQTDMQTWQEQVCILEKEISQAEQVLDDFRDETNSPLRLDAYFQEKIGEQEQKFSPWAYATLDQCRAELFLEAMALHKAFVQNSSYLRDNLDAFSKMLRGKVPAKQLSVAAPVLLQSFLLTVPVVSTTFASVGSFLRYIPQNEIAYLFIDEAGQAMPQSAVGAVWRAQNVIAVGDPLQIEPVVTLHDSVMNALAEHYEQNDIIASKFTSVQSLADGANRIGGNRTLADGGTLWIGAPLVVHNRCQKSVFQIANKIAYNEKMIFATKPFPDASCEWWHVSGDSEAGHYVPAQANAILELILDMFDAFSQQPDESQRYPSAFVISPFRSVKAGMAAYFRDVLPRHLKQRGISVESHTIRDWIKNCVGTIHTFQGKEADTVLLCLGVGSGKGGLGAVSWACQRPNILNVAITRSKKHLYIVGDKNIWAEKPFFKTALQFCK